MGRLNMSRLLNVSAVAGAMAAQIAVAMAADMPSTMPPPAYLTPTPPRLIQGYDPNVGWYVRGDLGYGWGQLESAQSAPGFTSPSQNKLGAGILGGVGLGIKTKWLRTDVTFDYNAPVKYSGTIATPDDVTAKISAWTALFNGYIDLGTWYRMTPYIGAGAGTAYVYTTDYASALAPPFSPGLSKGQWNFAYAGMTGVGFAISHSVTLDLGYRYVNFGDAQTGADASGHMTFKNVAAHEARLGLRWSFDDFVYSR
jgi:opacity protein-like surface antigen